MQAMLLSQSGREITEPTGLAEQVACGDPAAFERLIQLYEPRVTRLAHRLMGWAGDVDDIVQDVFLAALRSGHRFRRDASLWTWLSAITLNCCRNRHRRKAIGDRVLELVRGQKVSEPADAAALQDESVREVRTAMAGLPAKDREVIVLFYLEHRTIAEMGQMLRATPNAIEVRLHRARRRLRDLLAPYMKD
ncbi:MAG TPA: sigma-70 family RNA polymerase sigma factor [Tepidisphaeraceae bacterium]|jgi:RNA polymerase sigma-70 factor (ECF subfamily)